MFFVFKRYNYYFFLNLARFRSAAEKHLSGWLGELDLKISLFRSEFVWKEVAYVKQTTPPKFELYQVITGNGEVSKLKDCLVNLGNFVQMAVQLPKY